MNLGVIICSNFIEDIWVNDLIQVCSIHPTFKHQLIWNIFHQAWFDASFAQFVQIGTIHKKSSTYGQSKKKPVNHRNRIWLYGFFTFHLHYLTIWNFPFSHFMFAALTIWSFPFSRFLFTALTIWSFPISRSLFTVLKIWSRVHIYH